MTGFVGAKGALFCQGRVLVLLRDARPGLAWPGHWDLPGGGREGDESPQDCFLRELAEELSLHLSPQRLLFAQSLPSMTDPARQAWLFGGHLHRDEVAGIRLGDEGQDWALMPVAAFLTHDRAIPDMQRRAALVWAALGG